LLRAYLSASSARFGFDTHGLIAVGLDSDQIRLDPSRVAALYDTVLQRLSALPGVAATGLTRDLPLSPGQNVAVFADTPEQPRVTATVTVVSPRYFQTLGLTQRQGRPFDPNEPEQPSVAIIDDTMARQLWPHTSPIGRTFRVNRPDAQPLQIIGIVTSTREP